MTDHPGPSTAGLESARVGDPAPTLLDPTESPRNVATSPSGDLPKVPGYDVLARLGQGGMGVVFRARHTRLQRLVALKMIRDGLLATPAHVARFQAEARAVARLQHPRIVQIFEIGEHQGRPYFALELVEGGNLSQRLAQSALTATEAAELIEGLSRAIHHAHQHGIVHRDLKPANILLASDPASPPTTAPASPQRQLGDSADGERIPQLTLGARLVPKIADFGLAKELEAEIFLSHCSSDTLLGTPSYMAPEQAWGPPEDVGPSADVYSLGAILYECLTGKPPFLAGSLMEVLDQLRHRDPEPPTRINPSVPRDLETICLKCLAKLPAQRYASADDLAADLSRFLAGESIAARRTGTLERAWKWTRRRAALVVLSGLLLLTLTLGAIGAFVASRWARQQQEAAQVDLQRARYPELLQQAQQAVAQNRPDVARRLLDQCPPDVRGWEWGLLSELASGHTPPRLAGLKQPVQALAFDPSRGHLYAATDSGLRAWDQNTLKELPTLPTGGLVRGLSLSDDGRYLAALVEPAIQPAPARLIMPLPLHWLMPARGLLQVAPALQALPALLGTLPVAPVADAPGQRAAPPVVLVIPVRRDEVLVWDLVERKLIIKWICPSGAGYAAPVKIAFQPGGGQLAVLASARVALRGVPLPVGLGWQPACDVFACNGDVAPARPAEDRLLPPLSLVAFFDLRKPTTPPRVAGLDGEDCQTLAYSPSGSTLAVGSCGGQVRLLDPRTGLQRAEFHSPTSGTVVSLAYDRDGTRLAAGTAEGHVDLWNVETGELLHLLAGHAGPVRQLHFHDGAARLCTLGQDGYLKVWHAVSGQTLLTTRMAPMPYHAAMSLDGSGTLTAVSSVTEGGSNFGVLLFGARSNGKPEEWQARSGDTWGVVRRVPVRPSEPPLVPTPMPTPLPAVEVIPMNLEPTVPVESKVVQPPSPPIEAEQPARTLP